MSRDDIIDWLYDINVRADISIEEMADEIMETTSQQNEPCGDKMRLIDADALVGKAYGSGLWNDAVNGFHQMVVDVEDIDDSPTIEQLTWVPCSRRLPSERKPYLVCYTNADWLGIVLFDDTNESKAIVEKYHILVWMPLPEPYSNEPLNQ